MNYKSFIGNKEKQRKNPKDIEERNASNRIRKNILLGLKKRM
jgi:hypothetical protein